MTGLVSHCCVFILVSPSAAVSTTFWDTSSSCQKSAQVLYQVLFYKVAAIQCGSVLIFLNSEICSDYMRTLHLDTYHLLFMTTSLDHN